MENFSTVQQQLDTVNSAIYKILEGGQSYQMGTRKLTRADLDKLIGLRKELESRIAAGGSSQLFEDTVVAIFDGR